MGLRDGDIVNTTLGDTDGGIEDCMDGEKLGWRVGENDRERDGTQDGISDGVFEGWTVGTIDGAVVLAKLGKSVGSCDCKSN